MLKYSAKVKKESNMEKLITVFTPTYNRKELIVNCFNSLKRQTSYNFIWLIIDDGSTDDTASLVADWKKQDIPFEIRYCYKENGGLHTAFNKGIELADTELFVCIDSDDWMPDDAIEKIEIIWESVSDQGYVGIVGVDKYNNGKVVGDYFPSELKELYLYENLTKYHVPGDKKLVHKTDLLKQVAPMPSFGEEKFFNPSYMMYQLDEFGKLFVTPECFCIVDYQENGMSSNIYKQYYTSPRSFAETRKLYLSFPNQPFSFKFRQYIHYTSSCIISHKITSGAKEIPSKLLYFLAFPFGCLLSIYIGKRGKT